MEDLRFRIIPITVQFQKTLNILLGGLKGSTDLFLPPPDRPHNMARTSPQAPNDSITLDQLFAGLNQMGINPCKLRDFTSSSLI